MPILNHRDYIAAKARLAQLERALSPRGLFEGIADHLPADAADARQSLLKAEGTRIADEIQEYERLREGGDSVLGEEGRDDLGMLPILARVARRMSQRSLAERLDLREQQVQRYESERYAGIGLARYQRVLEALGVELRPTLDPSWTVSGGSPAPPRQIDVSPQMARAIRRTGWLGTDVGGGQTFAQSVASYIDEASHLSEGRVFNRRTSGAPDNDIGLEFWRARILYLASRQRAGMKGRFNIADTSWLPDLAKLSLFEDGPTRAIEFLRQHGIILVYENHMPHTLLDGAAFVLKDGIPIVALTLRHDRVDNFWFTLFHELAHVFLHLHKGASTGFIDNLDEACSDQAEIEADGFARSKLVPDELWAIAPARFSESPESIEIFAAKLGVHPAIVAGRIRKERDNYRIFNSLLGRGLIRGAVSGRVSEGD